MATPACHEARHSGLLAKSSRDLPDGGGGRADAAVPGNPGTGTTVAAARNGAGMTVRTAETAGGGESYGEGLRGSPVNAPTQGISGDIMARKRPATPSTDQRECLLVPRSAIESPERPTAVVGHGPSGKFRSISLRSSARAGRVIPKARILSLIWMPSSGKAPFSKPLKETRWAE